MRYLFSSYMYCYNTFDCQRGPQFSIYPLYRFKIEIWPKKADKYCPNSEILSVRFLASCQHLCEQKSTCTGFSFLNLSTGEGLCRLCNDNNLKDSTASYIGYDFYRRTGKSLFRSTHNYHKFF